MLSHIISYFPMSTSCQNLKFDFLQECSEYLLITKMTGDKLPPLHNTTLNIFYLHNF